jgi:hypothetical protein
LSLLGVSLKSLDAFNQYPIPGKKSMGSGLVGLFP